MRGFSAYCGVAQGIAQTDTRVPLAVTFSLLTFAEKTSDSGLLPITGDNR